MRPRVAVGGAGGVSLPFRPATGRKGENGVVPESASSPHAGWYPDRYRTGWARWFDGTVWTTHAVSTDEPRPDQVVGQDWQGQTPEETRQDRFATWDVAIPREGEPAFNGGAGVGGLEADRAARVASRYGMNGPVHLARWLVALTVILALLAWGDHRHRVLSVIMAVALFVAAVVVAIRQMRERAHWRDVGRGG